MHEASNEKSHPERFGWSCVLVHTIWMEKARREFALRWLRWITFSEDEADRIQPLVPNCASFSRYHALPVQQVHRTCTSVSSMLRMTHLWLDFRQGWLIDMVKHVARTVRLGDRFCNKTIRVILQATRHTFRDS